VCLRDLAISGTAPRERSRQAGMPNVRFAKTRSVAC
jgi:hypothetical protein